MSKQTDLINIPDAITVDGSNNVGIGTTSPDTPLEIQIGSSGNAVKLSSSTDGIPVYLAFEQQESGTKYVRGRIRAASNGADGGLIFESGSSGSMAERMRIDSSGNVGINTAVLTSAAQSGKLKVRNDVDYSSTEFEDNATLLLQNETPNHSATLVFHSDNATGSSRRAGIVGGNINSNTSALGFYGDIANKTSATKPDVIVNSSGHALFGTTTDSSSSTESGIINFGTSGTIYLRASGTVANNQMAFIRNGSTVGYIQTNGSSTSYSTSSDYRLKEDWTPMVGASERVQALNPVNFEWISDGTRVDGFLAHEAQAVVPESVTGTKDAMRDEEYEVTPATGDIYTPATDDVDEVIHSADAEHPETLEDGQQWRETTAAVMGTRSVPDYQGIDQSKLVPLLTAALQEALTEIASLKTRVQALEA